MGHTFPCNQSYFDTIVDGFKEQKFVTHLQVLEEPGFSCRAANSRFPRATFWGIAFRGFLLSERRIFCRKYNIGRIAVVLFWWRLKWTEGPNCATWERRKKCRGYRSTMISSATKSEIKITNGKEKKKLTGWVTICCLQLLWWTSKRSGKNVLPQFVQGTKVACNYYRCILNWLNWIDYSHVF